MRSRIVDQPTFSCKYAWGEVLTGPVGTPLAVGGSMQDNSVGFGRRTPKRTLKYPFAAQRLSSEMSIVLVIGEMRKTSVHLDQRILLGLIQGGPPATDLSHSGGPAVIAVVGGAGRLIPVVYFLSRRYRTWGPGARPEKQAPRIGSGKWGPHAKFH